VLGLLLSSLCPWGANSFNQSINQSSTTTTRVMNPLQEKRREESQYLTIKNVVGFQSNIVSSSSSTTFLHLDL